VDLERNPETDYQDVDRKRDTTTAANPEEEIETASAPRKKKTEQEQIAAFGAAMKIFGVQKMRDRGLSTDEQAEALLEDISRCVGGHSRRPRA